MILVNCNNKILLTSLIVGAVMVAVFFILIQWVEASLPTDVAQDQIDAALKDLSEVIGQEVTSQEQAAKICDKEQFFTACAEIGQEHNLFPQDEVPQVQTLLEEIKNTVAEELTNCQSIECLMDIANKLASSISSKHPELASQVDLTPKIVKEKREVVVASKEAGVDFKVCENMDPDTIAVDVLRKCAKLARDSRIKKYVPAAVREHIDEIGDYVDDTATLREALAAGKYQCGDNTVEGCGNYCLNPNPEAVTGSTSTIPPVCRQIAAEIFGPDGVKHLESRHQQLGQTVDFNYKKARNVLFTTLDGRTLIDLDEIGSYMEEQGRKGNIEAVSKGMDFMVTQGFATPADKEFAVKMVSKFKEKGREVDFDACSRDFRACEDFIHEDYRDDFVAMDEVFTILSQEIGFNPDLCERGGSNPSIGSKCLEGAKRALPKLEALVAKNPQVKFIIEEIKGHIARGNDLNQKRGEFEGSEFSGPGGCKSEQECRTYCSNPTNGPECIAFGAKHSIEGFEGEDAVRRFQEFQYNVQRPVGPEAFPVPGGFPGQGSYPGFQPPGFGFPPPGQIPGFPGPGPFPTGFPQPFGFPPGPGPIGPSPECFAAIQAGDFVKAKELCSTFVPPPPGPPPICPAKPYEPCPEGFYREGFVNQDGCFVDGECRQAIVCPPPPPPPQCQAGQYPKPKFDDKGCLVANECFNFGVYPTPPYPTPPYPIPVVGTCPSGYHYHGESGSFCINDREDYSGSCYDASGKNLITCPPPPYQTPPPGPTYSPYPTSICSPSVFPDVVCPPDQYYEYSYDSQGCTTGRTCVPNTKYSPYPSLYPSPYLSPYSTCPEGQYWFVPPDSGPGYCKSKDTYYSPYPSYSPYPTCPPDSYWDPGLNACKTNVTYSPYPTAGYSPTPYPTTEYSPPPAYSPMPAPTYNDPATACANSGGTWDGTTCKFSSSDSYNRHMATHCSKLSRDWNGDNCQPRGLFARIFESAIGAIFKIFEF